MPVEWSGDPDPRCDRCAYDRDGCCIEWATDSDPRFVLCLSVKQAERVAARAWREYSHQHDSRVVIGAAALMLGFWAGAGLLVARLLGRL